jgi:hypothetical protein
MWSSRPVYAVNKKIFNFENKIILVIFVNYKYEYLECSVHQK